MSAEHWGVVALVVLLPLLAGVARRRRARAGNPERIQGRAGDVPAPRRGPPPLPLPSLPPAVLPPAPSGAGGAARRASAGKRPASFDARTRAGRPAGRDAVAQWLRPTRNLRRAIVVATILGPRPH